MCTRTTCSQQAGLDTSSEYTIYTLLPLLLHVKTNKSTEILACQHRRPYIRNGRGRGMEEWDTWQMGPSSSRPACADTCRIGTPSSGPRRPAPQARRRSVASAGVPNLGEWVNEGEHRREEGEKGWGAHHPPQAGSTADLMDQPCLRQDWPLVRRIRHFLTSLTWCHHRRPARLRLVRTAPRNDHIGTKEETSPHVFVKQTNTMRQQKHEQNKNLHDCKYSTWR